MGMYCLVTILIASCAAMPPNSAAVLGRSAWPDRVLLASQSSVPTSIHSAHSHFPASVDDFAHVANVHHDNEVFGQLKHLSNILVVL